LRWRYCCCLSKKASIGCAVDDGVEVGFDGRSLAELDLLIADPSEERETDGTTVCTQ
jgi:hypothetical protein